jgi:hypothetical protein
MKIGITLNEVLRAHREQFHYVCQKYGKAKKGLKLEDITSFDPLQDYDFANKSELNHFLYKNCSLEVFGHADQVKENLFVKFNNFVMDIEDEEEHELFIVSRENNASIPATLFFLSKVLSKVRNIKFVKEYEDVWDGMDVIISANPTTIESKPEGKILIKINQPYNKHLNGDYNVDDVESILQTDALNKLLNITV